MRSAPLLAHATGLELGAWSLDPALGWCAVAAAAYVVGRRRWRRARPTSTLLAPWRAVTFGAGVALLALAVASPLDHGADELFSLHMVQHLLLGLVAPLLVVAAAPAPLLWRALPFRLERDLRRRLRTLPGFDRRTGSVAVALAVGAHVGVLVAWHVPFVYDAAVANGLLHGFEHLTMAVAGLALWSVVLAAHRRGQSGVAVLALFLTGLPLGAVAALLTLAPRPLMAAHLDTAPLWGLTALEDQQLAGAIMWVPGGIVYLAAAFVVVVGWLGSGPARGHREVLVWDG